jgi:hypothetical protein
MSAIGFSEVVIRWEFNKFSIELNVEEPDSDEGWGGRCSLRYHLIGINGNVHAYQDKLFVVCPPIYDINKTEGKDQTVTPNHYIEEAMNELTSIWEQRKDELLFWTTFFHSAKGGQWTMIVDRNTSEDIARCCKQIWRDIRKCKNPSNIPKHSRYRAMAQPEWPLLIQSFKALIQDTCKERDTIRRMLIHHYMERVNLAYEDLQDFFIPILEMGRPGTDAMFYRWYMESHEIRQGYTLQGFLKKIKMDFRSASMDVFNEWVKYTRTIPTLLNALDTAFMRRWIWAIRYRRYRAILNCMELRHAMMWIFDEKTGFFNTVGCEEKPIRLLNQVYDEYNTRMLILQNIDTYEDAKPPGYSVE